MIHLGDITKISGHTAPAVSVVIGGSPCQDLSVAGKRAGFDGERSVLFLDQIRVIKEMREEDERNGRTGVDVRPRFMVWENVPGAFSSKSGEDFRCVLEETARVKAPDAVIPGLAKWPNGTLARWRNAGVILGDGWSIAWRVLDAQFWGVPQRRRRIALVADFGGHAAPEILFERGGLSGDSETDRETGEGTAGDAENGVGTAVFGIDHVMLSGGTTYQGRGWYRDVSGCLKTQAHGVCCLNDQGGSVMGVSEDVAGTLRAQEHGHQPIVYNEETITSKANASNPHEGDPCHTLGATGAGRAICIQENCIDRADTAGCNGKGWRDDDVSYTLNTIDRPAVYAIDNHPADSIVKVTDDGVVQTLSSRMGTDGGNVPMCMCIGNGQADITTHITVEVAQTLNCMHDQMAVMTYRKTTGPLMANSHPGSYTGQDAYSDMLVTHTLKACGNEPHREDAATYPIQNNTVWRLTPLECERLQGYPTVKEWDVDTMTKDEFIALNLSLRNIIADTENGIIFRTRGSGGRKLEKPQKIEGTDVNGYLTVKLCCSGMKMQCRIHRIIWIAAHGIIPDGYCVDHINNNKKDNRLENLQLLTPEQNSRKAKEGGLYLVGEENPATKLAPELHDEIVYLYRCTDITQRELAEIYGISKSRINQIIKESPWTDIGEWVDSKGKKHISSDSARYKALGNSIALPPWRYVLGKLIRYCEEKTMASLFDGIGGFPLIWGELGGETLWASEIEEFPIAVTKRRFGAE